MPRPLSLDLRNRVTEAHQVEKLTMTQLAERFSIGSATVQRWIARLRRKKSLVPGPYTGCRPAKISGENLEILKKIVEGKSDMTLLELANAYHDITGVTVSISAMDRTLKRMGLTRKKKDSPRK